MSNVTNNVTWIKLNTDIFDVGKLPVISAMQDGATLELLWVKFLVLAGQANNDGYLYIANSIPFDKKTLANRCKVREKTMENAIKIFKNYGMIEEENGIIFIKNWAKYQNVDGMQKVREQNRKRALAYRERHRQDKNVTESNVTDNVTDNVTVTQSNATEEEIDIDKDIRDNKEKENVIKEKETDWMEELERPKKKRTVFTPPTIEQVKEYCESRNNGINAQYFIDYYATRNWMLTKGVKMSDWKAAVRTWEQNDKKRGWKQINSVADIESIPRRKNPFAEMAQRGDAV